MSLNVDLRKVVPAAQLKGEDEEDTHLLQKMLAEAERYLRSFSWCGGVREAYLGIGVGGIVGIFLFRIRPTSDHAGEWVWVVVGDLPSAYISVDGAPNPACALDGYIGAMEEWVDAADAGRPVDRLIPVNVAPTIENARQLRTRLEFLNREILSKYSDDLMDQSSPR
jgi:hypothetical protein